MSDNITLTKQRQCADLCCEDEKYILDIFSYVQPAGHGHSVSRKQLFLFITRASENNRSAFLQEEQSRLGMIKIHSDRFCWKKTEKAGILIVEMKMEDFGATRMIERRKIDEMRLPEKVTYTLPCCDASVMEISTRLLSESPDGEILLETEQLNAKLSLIPHWETKPGVEHDHVTSKPTEQGPVPDEEQMLSWHNVK